MTWVAAKLIVTIPLRMTLGAALLTVTTLLRMTGLYVISTELPRGSDEKSYKEN